MTLVDSPEEADDTGHMLKDQQALIAVKHRVVVRETLVVSDIIEKVQHRDG